MAGELRIGLLDVVPVPDRGGPPQALRVTREVARRADESGCSRYWLAEHHTSATACASPELLAGVLAEITHEIRIGVAGVLLRYEAPFKVAEKFTLLETLYPGRIDLGIARGVAPAAVSEALLDQRPAELDRAAFERRIEDVLTFLGEDEPASAPPPPATRPEVWALGMTVDSAMAAGKLGLCYSQALFLPGAEPDPAVLDAYRSAFRTGPDLAEPRCNVAVGGLIAATSDAAKTLADAYDQGYLRPHLIGDIATWGAALADLRARFSVDEIIYGDLSVRAEDRLTTVDLLMKARALAAEPAGLAQS